MATISKQHLLRLYKTLLREAEKFDSYNFRTYAIRRIQDAFRANKGLTDIDVIMKSVSNAEKNLEIIKRQVVIGKMYPTEKLVIENYLARGKEGSSDSPQ